MRLFERHTVRTNNFNDNAKQKIGNLWIKYMENKLPSEVYGIYHSYENNYKGNYTLSICTPIEDGSTGVYFEIDNIKYAAYPVLLDSEDAIFKTWQKIWNDEENKKLNRAYMLDYEHYRLDGVTIYISII